MVFDLTKLYISRWLKSPIQHSDGTQELPTEGTPQGGVISPLLANLYLHYAFDHWMTQRFPGVKFECALDVSLPWTSRMMGDYHVRFCEGLGGQFPWSTRQPR
jgi:retron-type reverse transcriptase